MILLIDNFDSFTYNLFHYFREQGVEVLVKRNDSLTADEALTLGAHAIVISPGPCDPDRAGICLDLIGKAAGRLPILGVCLGHQCIGQAFGGVIERAPKPMHGKVSDIFHRGGALFADVPSPFRATRYHSLVIGRSRFPACLAVTAESEDDVIQAVAHVSLPIFGVQFHPESIETEHGKTIIRNFLRVALHREEAA